MIGANDGFGVAVIAVANQIAAVTAAVIEHPDPPVLAAEHEHRLQADLAAHIIAGLRHFAFMPDIHPDLVPDLLQLAFEDGGIAVEAAMDAAALGQFLEIDGRCVHGALHHGGSPAAGRDR